MAETIESPPNEAASAIIAGLDKWSGAQTKAPPAAPQAPQTPSTPSPEPKPASETPKPPDSQPSTEFKLPSFVTQPELPITPEPPKEAPLEEFPAEPPPEIKDEKQKNVWKEWRGKWDKTKKERAELQRKVQELESKSKQPDEATAKRIQELERQNAEFQQHFQRASIENAPEFINSVLRPLQSSYTEAKRIITDAGGDPNQLDKAIVLTGKAQYDAMDEILSGLPESAKGELNAVMRDYKRYAQQRANALADAPRFAADMKAREEARQVQILTQAKQENEQRFDNVVKFLRDDYKFPLLRKSDEPGSESWNQVVDSIVKEGRNLFLENQDINKVAEACVLAPASLALYQLLQNSERARAKAEKELASIRGSEPTMSGSGAPSNGVDLKTDTKRPFADTFMDVLKSKPWENK